MADVLTQWKEKVESTKRTKASLEGKIETLQERHAELTEGMKKEFSVSTLSAMDKKIEQQEAKVEELTAELEAVFGEPA